MVRETKTEALVVGAGPVGMLTALVLAKGGVQTEIVDQNQGPAARGYACALHPGALNLLDRFGLAGDLVRRGRRIDTIAFYEGSERHDELRLGDLGGKFPFVLVLPQSTLEEHLEFALERQARMKVSWKHRLTGLQRGAGAEVVATVDKLAHTSMGYIVPHWEQMVERTEHRHAEFVIGTDGYHSLVRGLIGSEQEHVTSSSYAEQDFVTGTPPGHELRVVVGDRAVGALWPLSENRCRWVFQLQDESAAEELPPKEHRALHFEEPEADRVVRERLMDWAHTHAPWFTGEVGEIEWAASLRFESWRARSFGRDHIWLAGDAGHQTGPIGMQSLNVGLREAVELGQAVRDIIRDGASEDMLDAYARGRNLEWGQLLGLDGALQPANSIPSWGSSHANTLLPCIPASGNELAALLKQVGLEPVDTAHLTESHR